MAVAYPGSRLRRASERVVHETLGGEVILIHLDTGNYYSLRGAGSDVWELLEAGGDAQAIADALAARYEGDPDLIRSSVAEVLDRLVDEGLAAADQGGNGHPGGAAANGAAANGAAANGAVANGSSANGDARPFEPPILERYTDMQEYLLVDPIHDVDSGAWPPREAAQG
jgi:hypothetical protein